MLIKTKLLNVFDHCRWLFREIINKTKTKINKEIFKVLSILWINLKYGNELKEETPFISSDIIFFKRYSLP